MTGPGSFDLIRRHKKGWKPEVALVVSPYVEAEFFVRLARDLRPKRIHVVIDDGCRREDLETVTRALKAGGHRRLPFLKPGSARGLVHMKLIYIRWLTPGGRTANSLVFGSANATRQGFSGKDNAEVVAGCRLTASSHREVIDWCARVIEATRAQGEVKVPEAHGTMLSKGIQLRLPAIVVGREVASISNFDLWLQRGYLLSAYRPDPSFLRVPIPLSRPLRPGEQATLAASAGFEVPQTRSMQHKYVAAELPPDHERTGEDAAGGPPEAGNWRRRWFTWTQFGEWCSEACYLAHRAGFVLKRHEQRQLALEQLRSLRHPGARAAARDSFLRKLDLLWEGFGTEAPGILRGGREIDRGHYATEFERRIDRDLGLAGDEEFTTRFIRGVEIVPVPRFRNDATGWRLFVESLARQLVLDEARGRSQSALLGAVRQALDAAEGDRACLDEPGPLVAWLRRHWSPTGARGGTVEPIARYHEA